MEKKDGDTCKDGVKTEDGEHDVDLNVTKGNDIHDKTTDQKRWDKKSFVFFVEVFHWVKWGKLLKANRNFNRAVIFWKTGWIVVVENEDTLWVEEEVGIGLCFCCELECSLKWNEVFCHPV